MCLEHRVAVSSEVPPPFFWPCGTEVISHRSGKEHGSAQRLGVQRLAGMSEPSAGSHSLQDHPYFTLLHSYIFSLLLSKVSWDRRKRMDTLFPIQFVPWKGLLLFLLPYRPVSCVLPKGGWDEGRCGLGITLMACLLILGHLIYTVQHQGLWQIQR